MIVALHNHKGGIGKTTLSAHLGFRCDERGIPCLVVTTDPQADLLRWYAGGKQIDANQPIQRGNITALLSKRAMPPAKLMARYPVVIIDTPPEEGFPEIITPNLWVVQIDNRTALENLVGIIPKMVVKAPAYIVFWTTDEGGDVSLRAITTAARQIPDVSFHQEVIERGGAVKRAQTSYQPVWKMPRDAKTKVAKQLKALCDTILDRLAAIGKGGK